jgi:SlyX protein
MVTEERIITIETKLAYLENYINELNQVIIEQNETIKKLTLETEQLKKKVQDRDAEKLPDNERPPHY